MILAIPPLNNYGQEELAFWDGFLTEEEINYILALPEWVQTEAGCIGTETGESQVNAGVRSTKVGWVGMRPELEPLWGKLAGVIAEVNRRYFKYDLIGFYEPIQLGVYTDKEGGHYDWHTDFSPFEKGVPRKLSMAILLSNPSEFEGGEFQVKTTSDQARTLETKRGRAWFFPSYTLHRVTPVTRGVRRSLVLWVGGPPFR